MSSIKLGRRGGDAFSNHIAGLGTLLAQQARNMGDKDHVGHLVSLESVSDETYSNVESTLNGVAASLESYYANSPNNVDSKGNPRVLTPAQKMAGAMVASAYADPTAYALKAMKGVAVSQEGINLVDVSNTGAHRIDSYADGVHPAMEAFDERELRNALHFSVEFNIESARQDDFAELFYKTIVVGPDQAAIDATVGFFQVHKEIRYTPTSGRDEWHLQSLIEAHIDATILADQETRLYAIPLADGSNASSFVSPAIAGQREVSISGFTVPTAPLLTGKKHNLIGLSVDKDLMANGIYDNTDALDARLALENLYIVLADGEAAVPYNVSRLPLNSYLKTIEGQSREMSLRFSNDTLVVNGDTMLTDATAPAIAAQLKAQNLVVHLAVQAFGNANAQFNTARVDCPPVEVAAVLNTQTGEELSLEDGAGKAIVDALEGATVAGVDLLAFRTNSNRRTRGQQLDIQWQTDRYVIPLGSPLSCPSPITTSRDASDLKALVAAVRIRNSNNAITTLLNYADTLRDYVAGPKVKGRFAQIEGLGRYIVTPYFKEVEIDLVKEINSLRSWDKAFDVSACIVNVIREVTYRMYQLSGYQPALDANAGPGKKPHLAVGTDQVLIRHLMVTGDSRTFGTLFDENTIVSSVDSRVHNKIFLTYVRPQSDIVDPLNFGNMAWIPELTSSVMVNRNGATIKEAMVQPRSRHFNNLPILAVITVKGLDEVLSEAVRLGVDVINLEGADGASTPATPGGNQGGGTPSDPGQGTGNGTTP